MSRRISIVLGLLACACAPDVHIHIYNTPAETDAAQDTEADTEDPMAASGFTEGNADGSPMTSGQPSDESGTPATSGNPTTGADGNPPTTDGDTDSYPQPEGGTCPDGLRYAQVSDGFEFCAPPCDGGTCPSPLSGSAPGQCVFNPDSTNTPCDPKDPMCGGEETCSTIPGGTTGCALPVSHCALLCNMGQTCPDGMMCTSVGACQFPS